MSIEASKNLKGFLEELKRLGLPEYLQKEKMENARKSLYLDIKEKKERDSAFEHILMSDLLFQVTASFVSDNFFKVNLSNVSTSGALGEALLGGPTSIGRREALVEDNLFSKMLMNWEYQFHESRPSWLLAWLEWSLRDPLIPSDKVGKKDWIGGLEFHLVKKGLIKRKIVGGKFAGGPSEWLNKFNSDTKLLDDIRYFMEESKSKKPIINVRMLPGSYKVSIRWLITESIQSFGLGDLKCPYSEWLLKNVKLSKRMAEKLT